MRRQQYGYALVTVLILAALAGLLTVSSWEAVIMSTKLNGYQARHADILKDVDDAWITAMNAADLDALRAPFSSSEGCICETQWFPESCGKNTPLMPDLIKNCINVTLKNTSGISREDPGYLVEMYFARKDLRHRVLLECVQANDRCQWNISAWSPG